MGLSHISILHSTKHHRDSMDKRGLAMEHKYDPDSNSHYLSEREMIKYDDGIIQIRKQTNYIFDLQGECRKLINYSM